MSRVHLVFIFREGVAPERMPKADATGLAPKKSARHYPRGLIGAGGLLCLASAPFLWWSLGAEALGI